MAVRKKCAVHMEVERRGPGVTHTQQAPQYAIDSVFFCLGCGNLAEKRLEIRHVRMHVPPVRPAKER